ncbi:hypothetical protein [Microvirga makkahensis]|uniref:Uncharacterized protein n=1 Tax=Microvirga makkahensis TaxID=1128670 RepID=A0A7X3MSU3_9HYPH|nr:hypothetical protein [Microvirga makkahensis]MXQ12577.1 hypothetical protein [Microvirga makkahensis]
MLLLIADTVVGHPGTCWRIRVIKERNSSVQLVKLVEQYDLRRVLTLSKRGLPPAS